jgi:hypothetical protein
VWAFTQKLKTGQWQIEYRSGSEVCNATKLSEVSCAAGYEAKGDGCEAAGASNETLVKAIVMSSVLGICIALLGFIVWRHRAKAKQLIVSFLSVETLLLMKISFECMDFATDTRMITDKVVPKANTDELKDLFIPWIIFYGVSCLVFAITMVMRLHLLVNAIRVRRVELNLEEESRDSAEAKLLKHRKNLERTARAVQSIYATFAIAAAENFPIGIMQVVYAVRKPESLDSLQMISIVSSWASLGMGSGKAVLLKDYLPYLSKQRRKVKDLEALVNKDGTELRSIPLASADNPSQGVESCVLEDK